MTLVGLLPSVGPTFFCVSWVISKHSSKSKLGLKMPGVYSIPASVERSALDTPSIPLRPGWKSTVGFIIQRSQPWLITAWTWVTTSSFMIPLLWLRNPCIWNISLGKLQKLSSFLTTLTGKFPLSGSWKPLIHSLKEWRKVLSKELWLTPSWFDLLPHWPFLELLLFFCLFFGSPSSDSLKGASSSSIFLSRTAYPSVLPVVVLL